MKPVGRFSKFAACGLAVAAVCAACSVQAATGRAVVRDVRGTASYSEQGGEWQTLKRGQVLGPGTTVRTAGDGRVVLFLDENGPDLRVLESTSVGLDRLEYEQTGTDLVIETQLNLTAGTIQGLVRRLSAASKYEVKTPDTVVGVGRTTEPTEYQISVNGVVHVREGSMVVVYINPSTKQMSTHTLSAGQTFVPPVDPSAPGATPIVRPTRPDEWLEWPIVSEVPPLVAVPQPEPFVSPIHAPGSGSSSTGGHSLGGGDYAPPTGPE